MKFSQEQLEFIAKHFKRVGDVIAVRDGIVEKTDEVWWRAEYGPEKTTGEKGNHWVNMCQFWQLYQIDEPKGYPTSFVYSD